MTLTLVKPNLSLKQSYLSYIQELGDEERYPFPLDFDHQDFPTMLERIVQFERGEALPAGYVPSSTYWLVDDGELVGVSNLRHYLNDALRKAGGHIGLGVRPSCRGRGVGKVLLSKTLEEAQRKGIDSAHIHCYRENTASAKLIESCGGVLEREDRRSDDAVARYVIAL